MHKKAWTGEHWEVECEVCHRMFQAKRSDARTCSNACGARARRAKAKGEPLPPKVIPATADNDTTLANAKSRPVLAEAQGRWQPRKPVVITGFMSDIEILHAINAVQEKLSGKTDGPAIFEGTIMPTGFKPYRVQAAMEEDPNGGGWIFVYTPVDTEDE